MNTEVFVSKWKQISSELKQRWDKLTDDDVTRIEGRMDQLVGLLQERYGYSRDRVEQEVDRFLSRFNGGVQDSKDKLSEVTDTLSETVTETSAKVRKVAGSAPTISRQMVTECPWAVIVTVLGLGVVLGFLFRDRLWRNS